MASELHSTPLGIPEEVTALLCAIDGKLYSQPVWTLAKHRNGYSLRLFWGWTPPNGAHLGAPKKNRSRRRMESFLLRKKAESSKQPGIPSVPNEEFDPANIPEMGDHGCVCFEQSTLATVSSDRDLNGHPRSASLKPSLDVSPVANRTRSKARQTDLLSSSFCEHVTPVSSEESMVSDLLELRLPECYQVPRKCEDQLRHS